MVAVLNPAVDSKTLVEMYGNFIIVGCMALMRQGRVHDYTAPSVLCLQLGSLRCHMCRAETEHEATSGTRQSGAFRTGF